MNSDELRSIAADTQRLAQRVERIGDDASTLESESVNTETSSQLLERQKSAQDDLEQIVADLLAQLADSDEVDGHPLGNPPRTPVDSGSLPDPSNGRSAPWKSNGKGNKGGPK